MDPLLGPLKDFQRRTVDYVFQRMYMDKHQAKRFLVADEVGLGKTLVARGILARVLNHLYADVERVDIIYVCSNAAIASQNLNRLNVTGKRDLAFAARLTLLPAQIKNLKGHKINLVSFTPGTTFDLKSRGGRKDERADICCMLKDVLGLPKGGFLNLLQGSVTYSKWRDYVRRRSRDIQLDPDLGSDFVRVVRNDRGLMRRLEEGCERFRYSRRRVPREDQEVRYALVGELRQKLADVCIQALEPDLIILDEFQRFRDLLEQDEEKQTEAARLAQDLMRYKDARVLLLSATPYRMLTLGGESEDDHYEDFIATVDFLLQDKVALARLREEFRHYRQLLVSIDSASAVELTRTRDRIQSTLLSVMVRTERVASTVGRNAMLDDVITAAEIRRPDLKQAKLVDRLARAVATQDPIEYWKSAPYLLNVMKEYKLKEEVHARIKNPSPEMLDALRAFPEQLLRKKDIETYQEIDPQNGRLRRLLEDTIGAGYWRLLWMPPCLPYWSLGGAYAEVGSATKALVFSAWYVVPDVIAAIGSYLAELRIMVTAAERIRYTELTEKRKGLLIFKVGERGPESLSTLAILYPSPTLAREIDPLRLAMRRLNGGDGVQRDEILEEAKRILADRLRETGTWPTERADWTDPQWYWAAPILLDRHFAPDVGRWIAGEWSKAGQAQGDDGEGAGAFGDHVRRYAQVYREGLALGPAPDDLLDVLAKMALASPAVCALRSLWRVVQAEEFEQPFLLSAAAKFAMGIRSLFNNPDSVLLLRGSETEESVYWRLVLEHGMEGNLAAVLDEYVHMLREVLGLVHHSDSKVATEIATTAAEALSIRTSNIRVDEYRPRPRSKRIDVGEIRLRCRFALRFGELKDDAGETLHRIGAVREAFNSPFRPFILASTSIGQEGLDFHPYCHAVYHWNLPSNPVDLEQREGRIHRYKNHAVRKNVARSFGLDGLRGRLDSGKDPWAVLFDLARDSRPMGSTDLIPYWIYETAGGARVERRVPMLPFSREEGRLERLKASLAVYRLAFGQPRQEDLIAHLRRMQIEAGTTLDLDRLRISLAPPHVEIEQSLNTELVELIQKGEALQEAESTGDVESDDEGFFEVLRQRSGEEMHALARSIEAWARSHHLIIDFGSGEWSPSMHVGMDPRGRDEWYPLLVLYSYPKGPRIKIPFKRMKGAFGQLARRKELLGRLNEIPVSVYPLDQDNVRRFPSFPLEGIRESSRLDSFLQVIDWVVSETAGSAGGQMR